MSTPAGAEPAPPPLAGSAARTFYNVGDALLPPGEATPGAGDVDLWPALCQRLAWGGGRHARTLAWTLRLLEWHAWLRRGRSFSWLSREDRRRLLESWRSSALAPRRRAAGQLYRLVHELAEAHRLQSPDGA